MNAANLVLSVLGGAGLLAHLGTAEFMVRRRRKPARW